MAAERWQPTATWPVLRLRADLLRRLRAFFDERGFLEVETPLLGGEVLVETHLDPLSAVLFADPREPAVGRRMYLQTSPEAAMKRLMAAGGEAIYQVTRSFRGAERGDLHNPEFTIVEWYRRGDDMHAGIALVSDLAEALLARGACERTAYADAMRQHAGVDPHRTPTEEIVALLVARGIELPGGTFVRQRDAVLDVVLTQLVQPNLGRAAPSILYHYPATQASFAKTTAGAGNDADFMVAERFELFESGLELANGYHELTDADVLAQRMGEANDARHADGRSILPPAAKLIAAMRAGVPDGASFPNYSGAALGFDRLVMAAAGAATIDEVIAFPTERA
jgi:lysyl-tRNA synthetase class 2